MSFKLFLEDKTDVDKINNLIESLHDNIDCIHHEEGFMEEEESDYFASYAIIVEHEIKGETTLLEYLSNALSIDYGTEDGEEYAYDYTSNIVLRSHSGSIVEEFNDIDNVHTLYVDLADEDTDVEFGDFDEGY